MVESLKISTGTPPSIYPRESQQMTGTRNDFKVVHRTGLPDPVNTTDNTGFIDDDPGAKDKYLKVLQERLKEISEKRPADYDSKASDDRERLRPCGNGLDRTRENDAARFLKFYDRPSFLSKAMGWIRIPFSLLTSIVSPLMHSNRNDDSTQANRNEDSTQANRNEDSTKEEPKKNESPSSRSSTVGAQSRHSERPLVDGMRCSEDNSSNADVPIDTDWEMDVIISEPLLTLISEGSVKPSNKQRWVSVIEGSVGYNKYKREERNPDLSDFKIGDEI